MCDIATPVTHQRYTGNRAGSIMAPNPAVFEAMKGLLDGEVEPAEVTFPELCEAVFNS